MIYLLYLILFIFSKVLKILNILNSGIEALVLITYRMEGNISQSRYSILWWWMLWSMVVRMQKYLQGLDLWESWRKIVFSGLKIPLWFKSKCTRKKKDEKRKDKVMLVCKCFTNPSYQDHNPKVSQRNLGLFERRIRMKREDSRYESFELEKGVWDAKDERVWDNWRILKQIVGYSNKIIFLEKDCSDSRLVEKILVTVIERYETFIAFLRYPLYFSHISYFQNS